MSIAHDSCKWPKPALLSPCLHQHLPGQIQGDDQRPGIAFLKCATAMTRSSAQIQDGLWLETNHVQSFEQTRADFRMDCG